MAREHLTSLFAILPPLLAVACAPAGSVGFSGESSGDGQSQSGGASGSSSNHSGSGAFGVVGNGGLGMLGNGDAASDNAGDAEPDDPNCPSGVHTTVSGTVYDPSLQDPLWNITVFAPKDAKLPVLPTGASCNTCDSLFPPFYASTVTDPTGKFTLVNVPPGTNVPVVVQTGKWRKEFTIPTVKACVDNPQPDKTLRLPKNAVMGDGDLPNIAISTGRSDSLECLLLRIGVDADEWVAGPATTGHIHIFHGNGATTMPAAPASYLSLWDSTADLLMYDVALLSCEGAETAHLTDANRQSLLDYANMGGRVFASHYHYSWFNQGPFAAFNLATWYTGQQALDDTTSFPGDVYTTLLNGQPFPEGAAMNAWLGVVQALDANGMLDIYYARHNSDVLPPAGPSGAPSQPWIVLDKGVTSMPGGVAAAGGAQYFSVDTPVGAAQQCGRVVYSDLHVSGGAGSVESGNAAFTPDYPDLGFDAANAGIVPDGCAMHALTPQEKALEFMIFDLSSCLVPVGQVPRPPR
jgi:hypothetical protein